MISAPLPRLDKDLELHYMLLPFCRLQKNEMWSDPLGKHIVACSDAADLSSLKHSFGHKKASLALHDPPYNMVAFGKQEVEDFTDWAGVWIENTKKILKENSSLYVWLGADQKNHFEPFAEFILLMKKTDFMSKSLITMRNQRGYGTQKNWMAIRQELLYYILGNPTFNIENVYTEIPKVVKGYYKAINGKKTENLERSKSSYIRAGNVWIDVQQVFHLREENVNGCFAQKPLSAMERIISVSSKPNDWVIDFFAHAGTTLIACEKLQRKCFTIDIDPIYTEISIRRLERYRKLGKTGWQNSNPFYNEISSNTNIQKYLKSKYSKTFTETF